MSRELNFIFIIELMRRQNSRDDFAVRCPTLMETSMNDDILIDVL
jgi:hypothetical protein